MLTSNTGFDAIKTYVRIRPSPAGELLPAKDLLNIKENTIQIDQAKVSFSFDFVGGEVSTQQQVFEAVGLPLCQVFKFYIYADLSACSGRI
jgi:hypothetical protein